MPNLCEIPQTLSPETTLYVVVAGAGVGVVAPVELLVEPLAVLPTINVWFG